MEEKSYAIPYVGVCDVRSREDIAELQRNFSTHEPLFLKAGITMTFAALWGIPSKYARLCPPKRRIKEIFAEPPPLVLQVIHYADYAGVYVDVSLEKIIALGGPHLHAVQLDMVWPDPGVIEKCKKAHPGLQFILQVGERALTQVDDNPLKMYEALQNYDGVIDRVLLDRSMGKGKELRARSLVRFVDILYERMAEPAVVVAGGLGPETLPAVEPLAAMYPRLSIDAQSKLHEGGGLLTGPISMEASIRYAVRAIAMHRKYNVMS